ncbi:hypothetical protein [Gaoshiqia sp. Z1-71]|uniref:hypothetical protein n=1 Tax=Gaoshiqia hydrogeniformans TaxID=3290090 RepID=UPI003BF8BAFB
MTFFFGDELSSALTFFVCFFVSRQNPFDPGGAGFNRRLLNARSGNRATRTGRLVNDKGNTVVFRFIQSIPERCAGRQNARARVRSDKIFASFLSTEKGRTRPAKGQRITLVGGKEDIWWAARFVTAPPGWFACYSHKVTG